MFSGGSPGLVVMGGNLYSEGRGFESRHRTYNLQLYKLLLDPLNIEMNQPIEFPINLLLIF